MPLFVYNSSDVARLLKDRGGFSIARLRLLFQAMVDAFETAESVYTNKESFESAPEDTNWEYLIIPDGYVLEEVFTLVIDPNESPALPSAGTMTLERREEDGTPHTQLDSEGPIEMDKLDGVNQVLHLTALSGIDSDSANTPTKLVADDADRTYGPGQLCWIKMVGLTCAEGAEVHVWGRCVPA